MIHYELIGQVCLLVLVQGIGFPQVVKYWAQSWDIKAGDDENTRNLQFAKLHNKTKIAYSCLLKVKSSVRTTLIIEAYRVS